MSNTVQKILSGSILRVANLVLAAAVSIVITPFVIHTLGDHLFGIWTLVGTVVGYYDLLELGLSSAVTRFVAGSLGGKDEEQCNRVFNTALRIYLGLGVLVLCVTAVVVSLTPWVTKTKVDASVFWQVTLILGFTTALQFPLRVFNGVLQAQLRFDKVASFDLLTLILRTTMVVVLLLNGYSVVALAWATFFAGIPSIILCVRYTFNELPFLRFESRYWGMDTAKTLFGYSAFALIAVLANILRFQVDNVVVGAYLGFAAITHYRIAGALCQYFNNLVSAVSIFFPIFSRKEGAKDWDGIRNMFLFAIKIFLCVTSFVTFGMIVWGKPFIARWMGYRYLDAYPVLVVLSSAVYLNLSQLPGVGLLYGISRHKFIAAQNSVEGVVNLLLSLWLVRRYGMVGVALGTLIPTLVSKFGVQPWYVCRAAGLPYSVFLKRVLRTMAAVTGSLVLPLLLSLKFAAADYRVLFSIGLLSAMLYAASLWLFGFSNTETRLLTRAIWPGSAVKAAAD